MIRWLALVALLVSCQPGSAGVATPQPTNAVGGMIARTILLDDPGCTGVRIGGGRVLTAKHCMKDRVRGDQYSGFKVDYISPTHDFAVLTGDAPLMPVQMPDALTGEHVYVIGYPGSIDDGKQHLTVTDGIFTGVVFEDKERITAYAYYGNSGGGCWNDAGELVGIVAEMRPTVQGRFGPVPMPAHSYIVPVQLVRAIL